MKMKSFGLLLLPVLLSNSGCSYVSGIIDTDSMSDTVAYRTNDGTIKALAIPPGLTNPGYDDSYALPVAGSERAAVISSEVTPDATGQAGTVSAPATPRIAVASMKLKGGEPALAMNAPYEQAWQAVGAKLTAIGLKVEKEQPKEGIFTTVYQGNPYAERNILQELFSKIDNVTTAADAGDVLKRGRTYLVLLAQNASEQSFAAVANAQGKPAADEVATEILNRLKTEFERN